MIFSLLVLSPPTSDSSRSALLFAETALEQGHQLYRVFFYYDGAYHGSRWNCPPQDEQSLTASWQKLQRQHKLDIVVCIAAGLKRGILDRTEAERYGHDSHSLCREFTLGGLGQLIDAAVCADRFLTFGG